MYPQQPRAQFNSYVAREYGCVPSDQQIPVICVEDANAGGMSVTNDIEAVVAEVVEKYGSHLIVYKDSEGEWMAVAHDNGRFLRFVAVGPKGVTLSAVLFELRCRLRNQ
jgi:hypothetical protein